MRGGFQSNYNCNKKSLLNKPQLVNTSINDMPKSRRRKTTGFISTATNYNLEEMIAYIRQNPQVAQGVHHHLSQTTYLQQVNAPDESSLSQTPKRNLDSSENDGLQVSKQQCVLSNEKRNNQHQLLTASQSSIRSSKARRVQQSAMFFNRIRTRWKLKEPTV